jgi:glycosyltransferase involved in cell wall biosynthesis
VRILHISTRLILGGSQENTVLSCEGQARLGHDVHLAFGPIYGPEGSLLERVQKFRTADGAGGRGIATHVARHLVRDIGPVNDARGLRELRTLIGDLRPDIVHTHSSKAGILGRGAAWGARRGGMGIVHTIHGPPFMPVDGRALHRTGVALSNWLYTRAERFAARRCHVIVSVADAMTREFLARGIGKPEQYVTVRSGMEVAPFLAAAPGNSRDEVRTSIGLAPDDWVVGAVARLAEHKGHDDLLDALGDAMKNNPRMKLLWVGDGWWRDRLMDRVRSMGLEASVITTGLVPPDRIPGLIRAMDVLAHPSYREGLPRTVPQALLAGVCPVAYDCDGTGEVCRDMQTGRLVPTGDRAKLREAILWLMEHPRERAEMAARGREECRGAFSAETMVSELEKVYARAIEMARA